MSNLNLKIETINLNEIKDKTRKAEIVKKRKIACFELWRLGLKQIEIGRLINISQQAVSFHISTL